MRFYRLEKPNYFKNWSYAIFKALAIALILTTITMIVAGYKFMIVSSGSMEPTMPVGSLVIVTPAEYEDLELGDIVTMNAGGLNLTHRIVGKYDAKNLTDRGYLLPEDDAKFDGAYSKQYWWVTKGDNSDTIDGPLDSEIIGVVNDNHAFTWVGDVVRYVKANYQMLIILLVLFGGFITVMDWLKGKLTLDDIEVYEVDDEDDE
jgi:signal peptidase I